MRRGKPLRRLCIVRTTSGRDYHFPLAQTSEDEGYRLTRRSDSLQFSSTDGKEKMVFYKENVEVVRFEEGVDDDSTESWRDPIM